MTQGGGPREIGGLVSGKRILLAALVAASLVPVITWATLRKVEADLAVDQPPLVWAQRADWPSPPIKRVSLERPRSMYGGRVSEGKWRSYEFDYAVPTIAALVAQREERLSAAETEQDREAVEATVGAELHTRIEHLEAAVAECADLARLAEGAPGGAAASSAAFTDPAVRDRLEAIAAKWPELFYPSYLLGTWHRIQGDAEAANRHYTRAFALAPAVIKLRYVDPGDAPMVNFELGAAEITCDRVIEGELDQTLKLAYPHLETDARGAVFLPAFHAVYRATRLPQPPGYAAHYQLEGWFEFPGRIGSPKPTMVWKRPSDAGGDADE